MQRFNANVSMHKTSQGAISDKTLARKHALLALRPDDTRQQNCAGDKCRPRYDPVHDWLCLRIR